MIRRSYGEIQQPAATGKDRQRSSSELFRNVEQLIASRPELAALPEGDPYVRLAVLECRRRGWGSTAQILDVRRQLVERDA